MKQVVKLLKLPNQEKWLLGQTCIVLGASRLGLRCLSFHTLHHLIDKLSNRLIQANGTRELTPEQIISAVETSTYYMPGQPQCLSRAITTKIILAVYGYHCNLKLGVMKTPMSSLEAHAWIEYEGNVVIGGGQELNRFVSFPSIDY